MKNLKYVISLFIFCTTVITACGGSGGGDDDSSSGDSSSTETTLALGQASTSSVASPYLKGIGCTGKTAVAGTKLFVVDNCNSRVLVYNTLPTQNYQQADFVLGQPSFTAVDTNTGGVSASSLSRPTGVATDGTRLFVSDTENHRVLIWNTLPTASGEAADVVLGQADFTSASSGTTDSTFNRPMGLTVYGTQLFVADTDNHRVLIWNTIPTTNGQAADVVVGQNNFTDNSNAGFSNVPSDVATDGTKMIVVGNQMNPRIWNTIPTANGIAPDLDMGNDTVSGSSWNGVKGVTVVSGKLIIVGDNGTGTFIWNSIPTSAPTYADHEVGTHSGSPTALNMTNMNFVSSDGTRLFISDGGRVLIWNAIPTNNSTPANIVLGQADMTTNRQNFTPANAQTLRNPTDLTFAGSKLIVADTDNNRILIWNTKPTTSNQAANVVLGQASMTTFDAGTSSTTLNAPWSVGTDGTRLMTADFSNNRVLIWNTIPTVSGTAADLVLGQPNMTSNSTGATSTTMNWASDVFTNGSVVIVTDTGNHRVLIWNSIPTTNGQAADVVLGQPDMTSNSSGGGASGLNWADGARIYNGKLFVSDAGNCRVLIWNTLPTTNGQAADVVIGQPDMSTTNCNGASSSTLADPRVNYDSSTGRLYISDYYLHRILVWNTIPTTNGVAADSVIGQVDFTSSSSGSTATTFKYPWGHKIKDGFLWVADSMNARVLKMSLP